MTFEDFIMEARALNASDIHLTVGAPTVVRVNGELRKFGELSDMVVNRTILSILSADQEKLLTEGNDIDFSFELENGARQRVNVFRQSGRLACCIRLLNNKIPTLEELKMPPVLTELAQKRRGLILVTGPTGSGKSTTLAAIIDYINKNRACHVITIEDPVEYKYTQEKATIHQREVGRDVDSFSNALRSALREDPDVILVGEMRDLETIATAVTAAETGHLVFSTLHTIGCAETIDRIIDVFPTDQQDQIRVQLSMVLEAVISQRLIPTLDGNGRVAAFEVMIADSAIRNLIREGKNYQIPSAMQSGKKKGMQSMDDCLYDLYTTGRISRKNALLYSTDPDEMSKRLM